MKTSTSPPAGRVRIFFAGIWGFLCAVIFAAPVLAAHSFHRLSAVAYILFSSVCHQIPERSFILAGHPLAVCQRCSGIYIGLFIGSLVEIPFIHRSPRARRNCILAMTIPIFLDALLPYTGLWENVPFTRFLTGLLFGILSSTILMHGIAEFLNETSWRRLLPVRHIPKEAFHE